MDTYEGSMDSLRYVRCSKSEFKQIECSIYAWNSVVNRIWHSRIDSVDSWNRFWCSIYLKELFTRTLKNLSNFAEQFTFTSNENLVQTNKLYLLLSFHKWNLLWTSLSFKTDIFLNTYERYRGGRIDTTITIFYILFMMSSTWTPRALVLVRVMPTHYRCTATLIRKDLRCTCHFTCRLST